MNEGRPATYQTFPSHLCIHNYKATYSAASFAETECHLISPPYSHNPHSHHQHKTTDQKSPLTSQESTFSGSSCAIQRIHHSAERAFNTPRCLVLAAADAVVEFDGSETGATEAPRYSLLDTLSVTVRPYDHSKGALYPFLDGCSLVILYRTLWRSVVVLEGWRTVDSAGGWWCWWW